MIGNDKIKSVQKKVYDFGQDCKNEIIGLVNETSEKAIHLTDDCRYALALLGDGSEADATMEVRVVKIGIEDGALVLTDEVGDEHREDELIYSGMVWMNILQAVYHKLDIE